MITRRLTLMFRVRAVFTRDHSTFILRCVLLLSSVFSGGLNAAEVNSQAINCGFSNGTSDGWVEVTPLTSATPVGAVLWRRSVGLNANYQYGPSSGFIRHELVSAGYWTGGNSLSEGIAPTNIPGIGFKVSVNSSDGVLRPILQSLLPVAFEKELVRYEASGGQGQRSSLVTNYVQYLILTVPPSQLPGGKLTVDRVDGSAQLMLYAVDLLQGEASLGGAIIIPITNVPKGICRVPYPLMGPAIISMGGGGPITLPNTCQVEAYKTVPVELGRFALNKFPVVGATSPERNFSIELSQCAVNARPAITFSDKYAGSSDSTILSLQPTQSAAKGFGIVVVNGLTQQRIRYDATPYEMQRIGDRAQLPLRASYIRTGSQDELTPGDGNGAVEFTFTFP